MAWLFFEPSFQPELARLGLNSFEAMRQFFAPDKAAAPTGALVKPHALRLADGGVLNVFYKQYDYAPPGWSFWGRRSKARCEFENYAALQHLGLPVAERVAAGEERDALGRLRRAFIITRAVPDAQTLLEFVRRNCSSRVTPESRALRDQLWRQLAAAARAMHAGHFFHHDFVWRNILVNLTPENRPQIWLIDCPRGGVRRWSRHRHLLKDLASLDKSACQFCTPVERLNFLKMCLGKNRVDEEVKNLAREVLAYRQHRWPEDWK